MALAPLNTDPRRGDLAFADRRGGDFVFPGSGPLNSMCSESTIFQRPGQGFLDLQELGAAVDLEAKHILDIENVNRTFAKG